MLTPSVRRVVINNNIQIATISHPLESLPGSSSETATFVRVSFSLLGFSLRPIFQLHQDQLPGTCFFAQPSLKY